MKQIRERIELGRLVAKEINGTLSPRERQQLDSFVNESELNCELRRKFVEKFNEEEYLETQLKSFNQFNSEKAKSKVFKAVKRPISRKIYMLSGYAATIILLIAIGIIFFTSSDPKVGDNSCLLSNIGSEATLILDNGDKVNLNELIGKGKSLKSIAVNIQKDKISYNKKSLNIQKYNTLIIPEKSEYKLSLSDGTKVWLNPETSLKYPVAFTNKSRTVELNGEAYFQVAHNPNKPFKVKISENLEVEVLGTSFNISANKSDSNIETTLIEGSVKINSGSNKSVVLKPGEQARINKATNQLTIQEVNTEFYTSWKKGYVLFKDKRLEEVMNELTKWYNIKVVYKSESVKDILFTGNLNRKGSIDDIIKMFKLTKKVKVQKKKNTIIFDKR